MKKTLSILTILWAGLAMSGCEDNDVIVTPVDNIAPAVPRGVTSVTGDGEVEILWFENTEPDLAGYAVYRANTLEGPYTEIATVGGAGYYRDRGLVNGFTYFYAVTAFDTDGLESDLSYEDVFDTPRPEGFGVILYDFDDSESRSGFDFSQGRRVPATSSGADVFIDYDDALEAFFVEIADIDVDLQDFGYTESLDDLDWAPEDGWTRIGYSELILGHTYVVWDAALHFAKFRVTEMNESARRVSIDWAFQTVQDYPELRLNPHAKNGTDQTLRRLRPDGTIGEPRR